MSWSSTPTRACRTACTCSSRSRPGTRWGGRSAAWSNCRAYAAGTSDPLITYHPSHLALRPYPAVQHYHYHTLPAPSDDPPAMPGGQPSTRSAARSFSPNICRAGAGENQFPFLQGRNVLRREAGAT